MSRALSSWHERIDLARLHPAFRARLVELHAACLRRGSLMVATSGGRTYDEQEALYAKGRTAPGEIVTRARPGRSAHNFLAAADLVTDADANLATGLQPDYSDPAYVVMGEEAARLGLEWGGTWKSIHDTPHVQLALEAHGLTMAALDRAYRSGGYKAVFALIDSRGPW